MTCHWQTLAVPTLPLHSEYCGTLIIITMPPSAVTPWQNRTSVILTERNAMAELLELAGLEREIKHPYQALIQANRASTSDSACIQLPTFNIIGRDGARKGIKGNPV